MRTALTGYLKPKESLEKSKNSNRKQFFILNCNNIPKYYCYYCIFLSNKCSLCEHKCYGFQFPGFLHLSITSALSGVLAQCILPSSMLHLRSDCLSPVLYQRSLPSLYLLHSPCRLCEVLPLYVCMSEHFSFYSVYLLSLTHAELTLSICLQPALRPPARSGF